LERDEVGSNIGVRHRGGREVDARNRDGGGGKGDRVRRDVEVRHEAPRMLGSQEVDATTGSTPIVSWLRSRGQKTTVLLSGVVIDKPRLRHEEKIIDGIQQAAADVELVT